MEKKARADVKTKADGLKPVCIVQFQGGGIDLSDLAEAAKADFRKEKKRTPIPNLKLYVKPEERTACRVVNEKYTGSISYLTAKIRNGARRSNVLRALAFTTT